VTVSVSACVITRDGVPGPIIAAVSSFHLFLEFAKLWELEQVAGRPDV
jgi:hypothetical protein